MENLWMLVGGLGCLALIAVLWRPPSIQDDDLQAMEIDLDPDDFE